MKLGVPWRGIWHDWTKFLPDEFFAHADWFFWWKDEPHGPNAPGLTKMREHFHNRLDRAWAKHQRRNKHHFQYWTATADDGTITRFPMPDKYRKEMLADWRCRAAQGKETLKEWWQKNDWYKLLHVETYNWFSEQIEPGNTVRVRMIDTTGEEI